MFHFRKPIPRYRLRTLLVGVTLTCLLLTALPYEARQYHQHKARSRSHIVSLGGTVDIAGNSNRPSPGTNWISEKLGYSEPREALWSVNLAGITLSDKDIEKLRDCSWIILLNLSGTNVSDDSLNHIAELANLRGLKLANTAVTDAGIAKLRPLTYLRLLDVAGTAASYDGLRQLEQTVPGTNFQEQLALSRVRARGIVVDRGPTSSSLYPRTFPTVMAGVKSDLELTIFAQLVEPETAANIHFTQPTKLRTQDVDDIRRLESLRAWFSSGLTFPDGGLEFFTDLSKLKSITIDDAATGNITDDDLTWLAQLPRLESLEVSSQNLTDAGIKQLAASPRLASLTLAGNGFTDSGFAHLSDMHQLRELAVHSTKLTPKLVNHLRGLTGLRKLELNLWHRGAGPAPFERPPPDGVIAAAYESMKYHAEIPNLKQVSYSGNLIVAELLAPLTELTALEWLKVDGRFVSHEEARALQIAMPHCHVQRVDFD